jgi:hypothetical protein
MKRVSLRAAAANDPSADEKRVRLLKENPAVVGANWAVQYLEVVRESGRQIEGGWPGTVAEARMRVLSALPQTLLSLGFQPLNHEELVAATAIAYAEARRSWQLASKGRRATPAPAPAMAPAMAMRSEPSHQAKR